MKFAQGGKNVFYNTFIEIERWKERERGERNGENVKQFPELL